MNNMLNALKKETNFTSTENSGLTHKTTNSKVLDMFAMGGAYRNRNEADVLTLFSDAYREDKLLALKCLFYLRDVRGGQGERRFFRECLNWLAQYDGAVMLHNIKNIPEFGRWDDLYTLFATNMKPHVVRFMKSQLESDITAEHPSLLAKWMKSENTSSAESKRLAKETRLALKWSPKQYRRTLSNLRRKIDVVERKMSAEDWEKIKYEFVPSKAGLLYRNAFKRHDEERYMQFINNKQTKVKAATLYPYEVVEQATRIISHDPKDSNRLIVNKYWDNLKDYLDKANFDGIAMVDTSASMCGTPINVAISLGMYLADKANGPFHNHYISFSSRPQLIETSGFDFVDKVQRIYRTNLCENTNIEAAFNLLLNTAVSNHLRQEDMPKNIIVISDMEFDAGTSHSYWSSNRNTNSKWNQANINTAMEEVAMKWRQAGYIMPNLIYWNVDARQNNIPQLGARVSFVSGFSPSIFETIMTGKTGYELMLDKLNSPRYESVKL